MLFYKRGPWEVRKLNRDTPRPYYVARSFGEAEEFMMDERGVIQCFETREQAIVAMERWWS